MNLIGYGDQILYVKLEVHFKRFDYKTTYGSYLCELYNIAYYKLYSHLGKIL